MQRVEYVVLDVRGEKVYVTADGLAYTEDSLEAKDFQYLIIVSLAIHQLITVVVKIRRGIKFFYNMHSQTSGRVKGYRERVPPQVWYIVPGKRRGDFGLRQK